MPTTAQDNKSAITLSSNSPSNTTEGNSWLVYIIECSDSRLYTGITNNLARRWRQHCGELKNGAKFFRGRTPRKVRFVELEHSRVSAAQREYQIKQLSRDQKLELIQQAAPLAKEFSSLTLAT